MKEWVEEVEETEGCRWMSGWKREGTEGEVEGSVEVGGGGGL